MAQWWDNLVTGLGNQSAPFGFAPGVDPKTAGMNVIGGIGANMLGNITQNPLQAFGGAYKQQMEDSQQNSRDALSAKVVMDQMEEKKRERAAAQEQQAQMERMIGMLPPDQQALARMLPEKFFGAQIQSQFNPPEGSKAPAGYRFTTDGNMEYIKGGPADPTKPIPARALRPTTDQNNAAGFYDRMLESEKILDDPNVVAAATDYIGAAKANAPLGIGNYLATPEYQKFDQATRNFVNAVLRKESGAAISESEFESARKQYFPQPGDTPGKIAQKAENRKTVINAMKRTAAGALLQGDNQFQAVDIPAPMDSAPEGVDPEVWNEMTPEEKAAWQN